MLVLRGGAGNPKAHQGPRSSDEAGGSSRPSAWCRSSDSDAGGSAEAQVDATFDAWLAGWQSGGAGKSRPISPPPSGTQRQEGGAGSVSPAGSKATSSTATANNPASAAARGDATPAPGSLGDGKPGDEASSDNVLEAAMGAAVREETRPRKRGNPAAGRGLEESALLAAEGTQRERARKKTAAQRQEEDEAFLRKVRKLEKAVEATEGLFTRSNISQDYLVPDYDALEPGVFLFIFIYRLRCLGAR